MTSSQRSEIAKESWRKRRAKAIESENNVESSVEKGTDNFQVLVSKSQGVIKFITMADNDGNTIDYQFEKRTYLRIQEV